MTEQRQDDVILTIADGYAFDEQSVQLGVLMTTESPVVEAPIRIPVSMFNRHGLVAARPAPERPARCR